MGKVFGNGRYANVTATMALIVALGGTSYAAITLPKNSVGFKQIKKNAVTNSKIRANAVTSSKVKNGSLLSADFAAGQLPAGPAGPAGAAGAKGDTGAKGATGETGAPGTPATVLWASVTGAGGTLNRNSHAVSSSDLGSVGNGSYEVVFDRDVSGCVYSGQLGGPNNESVTGQISVTRRSGTVNGVFVVTSDSGGTGADLSFYVSVFC